MLLGFSPGPVVSQQTSRARAKELPDNKGGRPGIIKGKVGGVEDSEALWPIVIDDGRTRWGLSTDKNGEFTLPVPAGVYTARVSSGSDGLDGRVKYVPFLVRAGAVVEIEVDPAYQHVYCTSDGDRVVPVSLVQGANLKGLRRVRYEQYLSPDSDPASLPVVVQSCKKTTRGRIIEYKSAVIGYNKETIAAGRAEFDPQQYRMEGWDVGYLRLGMRVSKPYLKAAFRNGEVQFNSTVEASKMFTGGYEIRLPKEIKEGSMRSSRPHVQTKVLAVKGRRP